MVGSGVELGVAAVVDSSEVVHVVHREQAIASKIPQSRATSTERLADIAGHTPVATLFGGDDAIDMISRGNSGKGGIEEIQVDRAGINCRSRESNHLRIGERGRQIEQHLDRLGRLVGRFDDELKCPATGIASLGERNGRSGTVDVNHLLKIGVDRLTSRIGMPKRPHR